MKTPIGPLVRVATVVAFAFGIGIGASAGCEKKESRTPGDGGSGSGDDTLCTQYSSCDACIAGEKAQGMTEGEAETACGAAVLGCWTTWDKPITCAGKEHKKDG